MTQDTLKALEHCRASIRRDTPQDAAVAAVLAGLIDLVGGTRPAAARGARDAGGPGGQTIFPPSGGERLRATDDATLGYGMAETPPPPAGQAKGR